MKSNKKFLNVNEKKFFRGRVGVIQNKDEEILVVQNGHLLRDDLNDSKLPRKKKNNERKELSEGNLICLEKKSLKRNYRYLA